MWIVNAKVNKDTVDAMLFNFKKAYLLRKEGLLSKIQ